MHSRGLQRTSVNLQFSKGKLERPPHDEGDDTDDKSNSDDGVDEGEGGANNPTIQTVPPPSSPRLRAAAYCGLHHRYKDFKSFDASSGNTTKVEGFNLMGILEQEAVSITGRPFERGDKFLN